MSKDLEVGPVNITIVNTDTGESSGYLRYDKIPLCTMHRRESQVAGLKGIIGVPTDGCVACEAYDRGYKEAVRHAAREQKDI